MGVSTYDVGSLPFVGDYTKFMKEAETYQLSSASFRSQGSSRYFEEKIVEGFLDKMRAGVDFPNYPQFRDMNRMFLGAIDGVEKAKEGFVESGALSVRQERAGIPEVIAIKSKSREIREKAGRPFEATISVTGPYTLSRLFVYRDSGIFNRLERVISRIVENNIFKGKHGRVKLVVVDEPSFGLQDDSLIDYGTDGRENLRVAWESIFNTAASMGVHTGMHLHDTADGLFWEVKSLNVVDTHVDDPIYRTNKTKELLESTDKSLKASISVTNFDDLITSRINAETHQQMSKSTLNEKVAEVWKSIHNEKVDPTVFLEATNLMKERLTRVVDRFGAERVPYAGPECGFKGFPNYECALEGLRRASNAVDSLYSQNS